jgi:hypothetical protein
MPRFQKVLSRNKKREIEIQQLMVYSGSSDPLDMESYAREVAYWVGGGK